MLIYHCCHVATKCFKMFTVLAPRRFQDNSKYAFINFHSKAFKIKVWVTRNFWRHGYEYPPDSQSQLRNVLARKCLSLNKVVYSGCTVIKKTVFSSVSTTMKLYPSENCIEQNILSVLQRKLQRQFGKGSQDVCPQSL